MRVVGATLLAVCVGVGWGHGEEYHLGEFQYNGNQPVDVTFYRRWEKEIVTVWAEEDKPVALRLGEGEAALLEARGHLAELYKQDVTATQELRAAEGGEFIQVCKDGSCAFDVEEIKKILRIKCGVIREAILKVTEELYTLQKEVAPLRAKKLVPLSENEVTVLRWTYSERDGVSSDKFVDEPTVTRTFNPTMGKYVQRSVYVIGDYTFESTYIPPNVEVSFRVQIGDEQSADLFKFSDFVYGSGVDTKNSKHEVTPHARHCQKLLGRIACSMKGLKYDLIDTQGEQFINKPIPKKYFTSVAEGLVEPASYSHDVLWTLLYSVHNLTFGVGTGHTGSYPECADAKFAVVSLLEQIVKSDAFDVYSTHSDSGHGDVYAVQKVEFHNNILRVTVSIHNHEFITGIYKILPKDPKRYSAWEKVGKLFKKVKFPDLGEQAALFRAATEAVQQRPLQAAVASRRQLKRTSRAGFDVLLDPLPNARECYIMVNERESPPTRQTKRATTPTTPCTAPTNGTASTTTPTSVTVRSRSRSPARPT